jgi:hypothetical protein
MTPDNRTQAADHDELHEELLHAHLAGDVAANDALLATRLRTCATCATRLAELRSLTVLLERVAGDERAVLAKLSEHAGAPGSERVATTLRALAAGQDARQPAPVVPRAAPGPVGRPATLWRVTLAAASVLAAGWLVRTLLAPSEPDRQDVLLGEGQQRAVYPRGTVKSFDRFEWTQIKGAVRYELRIWPKGLDLEEDPVKVVPVYSNSWIPTSEEASALPREIYWEATPYDDLGTPLPGGPSAYATRADL